MTDKELEKYADNLAKFTTKSVNGFRDEVKVLERNLFGGFMDILSTLIFVDGALSPENDLSAIVAKIDQLYIQYANSPQFVEGVGRFLKDFSVVRKRALDLQEELNDLKYTPQFMELLDTNQRFLLEKTQYDLSQGMLKRYFVEDAKQIILEGAYLGYSQQELSKRYRDRLLTQPDKDSYYMRYATQLSRDSLYTYNGQVNQAAADEYELDCVRYIGSVKEDTRPLCNYLVKEKKRYFKRDELPAILGRFAGTSGVKPETNEDNFYAVRGGWNCGHEAIPVRC